MGLLQCDDDNLNIGVSSCKKLPQQPKVIITTPPGFSLTLAQIQDKTAWQDAMIAAKGVRIYLFPPVVVFENISEAAVYEEGSLADIAVRDGRYKFRMSVQENLNLHKNIFSHKNFQGRVWILDDKNQLIGMSDDNELTFKGFTIGLFNPEKLTFNDGSVASKTPIYLSLADNLELDETGIIFDASFINTLIRLTTVDLLVLAVPVPSATGFKVSVLSELDNTPILGLVLADFVLLDAAGSAQTITVLLDNGDGTYDITGVGLITGTIDLVSAATLGIKAFESSGSAIVTVV